MRPALALHDTYYTKREPASGTGLAASNPLNHRALETAVELRPPALERVFAGEFLGRKWKHVIEPRVRYRFVTGIDEFANTVKFDERDILTDTHEVEYGFVTRLYSKRISEPVPRSRLRALEALPGMGNYRRQGASMAPRTRARRPPR